jgi:hypothetical protein
MKKNKMNYNEEELIAYLCLKVDGIGEKTAIRIAGYMEDFDNFCNNTGNLINFTTDKGTKVVNEIQIEGIRAVLAEYIIDYSKSIQEIWISILIKDFVKNALWELQNTTLESLSINPFLIKAFGFTDHKEVVTFYFYQKITRSIVTSWGFTIENLLRCSGAENSGLGGFDMKVYRNNLNYHFQVKSSPVMSVEQVRALNTHFKNVDDKVNNLLFLGISYGNKSKINEQIKTNLIDYPNSVMIGKELWDFIAEETGYYEKILGWIDEIANFEPIKFSNEIDKKRNLLIIDWEKQYSTGKKSIDKVLEIFL